MIAAVLALAAITDLCAAPSPPPVPPDPAEAARYVDVAEAEREAGQPRTAAVAYRAALARDPDNGRARAGLRELCADSAEAPAAELLEGVSRFLAGDLDAARAHLHAATGGGEAVSAGAHFFLGSIAAQRGDRGLALRELALASADPAYAGPARAMRRLARRRGRVSLSALVASEWDSNVRLVPDSPPTGSEGERASDGGLFLLGSALVQPVRPLLLGATVFARKRFTIEDMDLLGVRAAAELGVRSGSQRPALRLELLHDTVGGDAYALALGGTLAHTWQPSDAFALGARYGLRRRSFPAAEARPFDGFVHLAALQTRVRPWSRLELSVEGAGGRELTRDPELTAWTAGVDVGLRLSVTPDLRLAAGGGVTYARYDLGRRDARWTGSLDTEVDLTDHLSLVAGLDAEREDSSRSEFRTLKVVVHAGVAGYVGLP